MTKVLKNVCRICSTGCGINVCVENDKIVKIEGMPEFPVSKGTICTRAASAINVIYAPDRLLHPLKRVGERGEGKWRQITWDEALDTISQKLSEIKERHGPEALAFTAGQQWHWNITNLLNQRFCYAFGSPNFGAHTNMCFGPNSIAMLTIYGPPYARRVALPGQMDYEEQPTKCIVLWGTNPFTSRCSRAKGILDAKEKALC